MPTIKPWWASRTILGALVMLLAPMLGRWGITLSEADQADIVELLSVLAGAGGFALTVFGRVKASAGIGKPSGNAGGTAAALLLAALLSGPLLVACATPEAETPQQRAFALEADYQIVQRAALAYVTSDFAEPAAKARVQDLESVAYAAVKAMREAARSGADVGLPAALAAAEEAINRLRLLLKEREVVR